MKILWMHRSFSPCYFFVEVSDFLIRISLRIFYRRDVRMRSLVGLVHHAQTSTQTRGILPKIVSFSCSMQLERIASHTILPLFFI